MDEEADAGDDAEHDEGEVVDGEGEVDLEAGDGDPGRADDAMDGALRRPCMALQSQATSAAGMAVKSSAIAVTAVRGSLRPRVPLSRKPAKGSSGISQR